MPQPIASLEDLHELREAGDYDKLASLIGKDWQSGLAFEEESIHLRLYAAEIAGRAGRLDEMEVCLQPYIDDTSRVPLGLAAQVLVALSLYHYRRNQPGESLRLARQSRAIAEAREDESTVVEALQLEGQAMWVMGRSVEVVEKLKEAISHYTVQMRPYRQGLSHLALGTVLSQLGRVEEARVSLERGIKMLLKCQDEFNLAAARLNVATPLNALGEHETALTYLNLAYEKFVSLGQEQFVYLALNNIAATLVTLKEYDKAEGYISMALEKGLALRTALLPLTYEIKARVHLARREWGLAEQALLVSLEIAEQTGDLQHKALARRTLGRLYLAQDHDAQAAASLWPALDAAHRLNDSLLDIEVKALLAQALCKTDPAEACRFISDVDAALGSRPLPELKRDAQAARRRIDSLDQEHFFVLSDAQIPLLADAKMGLLKWLWARALHKARGNAREAAKILGVTPTYIRKLTKVIPRDLLRTGRKSTREKAAQARR
jgi:tetratricopeptide (TPR) repeat protein